MALSAARTSVLSRGNIKTLLGKHGGVLQVQVASVAHMKATWGGKYPYKKPWPYDSWKFNVLHELYDNSLARLNENSKVIVVEGNIGCGKNEFAQRLAKNFDLKFVPGITEDQVHSNNGFKLDMRILDDILPESAQQTTNLKVFHSDNPEEGIAGRLQYFYYAARFMQYCRAMLHLFNTGQGVVIVRTPWSDRVFCDALREQNFIRKRYMPWYNVLVDKSIPELVTPHLTIYLDTPVDVCMKNIKARGREEEKGKNFTPALLESIESVYRNSFLPRQKLTHEVLELDWSTPGDEMDMDVITEEICRIPLHSTYSDDPKFDCWRKLDQDRVGHYRKYYGSLMQLENMYKMDLPFDMPEISYSKEDIEIRTKRLQTHPCVIRMPGYASALGDKFNPFKVFV